MFGKNVVYWRHQIQTNNDTITKWTFLHGRKVLPLLHRFKRYGNQFFLDRKWSNQGCLYCKQQEPTYQTK